MHKIEIFIHFAFVVISTAAFNCKLPIGCKITYVHMESTYLAYEPKSEPFRGLECDILYEKFQFIYPMPSPLLKPNRSCRISFNHVEIVQFRFHGNFILGKQFNFTNMLNYMWFFENYLIVTFVNVKGFELDIDFKYTREQNLSMNAFHCIKCYIEFYSNDRPVKSCQDIIDYSNSSDVSIRSLFQIQNGLRKIILLDLQLKTTICPLVFKNSDLSNLEIIGLADTFYKRNILNFENRTFDDLNSNIVDLEIKTENLNIDSNLLNPWVFETLQQISFFGQVNMINGTSLNALKYLNTIIFVKDNYRDMIHKNGIKWIRDLNPHLNVNLSNFKELKRNYSKYKIVIRIPAYTYIPETRLSKLFPDKDFCLYKDFPFNQLVILMEIINENKVFESLKSRHYTCTYLWLAQHFDKFLNTYKNGTYNSLIRNYEFVVMSESYKSMSKCDFQYRLSLCNKSTYHTENWWGRIDYSILNKKLQTAFKIGQYLVALFGIATNLLVVIIILHKKNKETFKDLNHYSYLWLNSVFNLLILVITIISWISECFYPFEVFCPEIHKAIFNQFFKIIFKEVIVTLLKFMCNFNYVAFALNRIALIGKDPSKIVKFISELDIKIYTLVTFLISCGFSWIKYFKFQVNYFEPYLSYPISNEWQMINVIEFFMTINVNSVLGLEIPYQLYFIYNSITDLVNFVVFVIVCIIIDVFMVVRMKQTLDEKLKWYDKETNSQKYEAKKKEYEDAINKLTKMVVINTAIGVLFKLPSSFMSIVNLYATFYYRGYYIQFIAPSFGEFYSYLLYTDFFKVINDIYDFLFIVSISIQFFIYKHFDKKFFEGYNNMFLSSKKNKN